jgi:hypothetical protein
MDTNHSFRESFLRRPGLVLAVLLGLVCLVPTEAFSMTPSRARVLEITGEAQVLKEGASEWAPLVKEAILLEGDSLRTGKNSEVKMELMSNRKTADMILKEDSEFSFKMFHFEEVSKTENTLLDVAIGGVLVKAEKLAGDSKFEVNTPTSIVGIRGTIFEVQVSRAS